jgi:ribosomal protein S18 acetylase RimI-like enzyme
VSKRNPRAFMPGRFQKRTSSILDIHRLVVHPAYFRRGIGKTLVQFVEQVEDGIETIIVSTGAKNVPAKRLYTQLGFVEKKEEEVIPGLIISLFEKNIILASNQ